MGKVLHVAVVLAFVFVSLVAPRAARAAGTLYVAQGGTTAAELPLERTDVEVDVAGSLVSATVLQRFRNTHREPIEVVYVFPLPQRAAVDAMEMKVGPRTIRASIARRQEARDAYETAVRQGRRAALLEQERPNVFTFSVANIDPGAAIDVKLHYFEVASYDEGTYELVVPTTIGPRYVPGAELGGPQSGTGTKHDTDRVPDASRVSPGYGVGTGAKIAVRVHLDAGTDLDSVTVPTHAIDLRRPAPGIADVRLKSDAEIPNKDFVFRWRLAAPTMKPAMFTHRTSEEELGYLSLLLEPKHGVGAAEVAPRELFFVLDTSGSMQGAPLEAALGAVRRAIDAMGPTDSFQIVDFADSASTFAPKPLSNTPANRKKAHEYLDHLRASGGTNQLAGIHAALSADGDENRIRYVMFMTDGYIGNEAEVADLARREIGRARIFSFGVGQSVNRYLLDEVAAAGRGFAEYLRPGEDPKELVERFYRRIGRPYLTDIRIDWGTLAPSIVDARPASMPDLSAFEPLVLHARYRRPGDGVVTVTGKVANKPFTSKIQVTLPAIEPKNAAISRLWARATITELERRPAGQVDGEAITRIALAHDLVTRFTSFIAIDSTPPEGSSSPLLVKQPSEAPAGVDLAHAGGTIVTRRDVELDEESGAVPAAASETTVMVSAPAPRHGGCASCTAAPVGPGADAWAALTFAAAAWILRRRSASTRAPAKGHE